MIKIKICGITNLDDALAAIDLGADALGFNFCAASPRFITPDAAGQIIDKLPAGPMNVGVFVNSDLAEIQAACMQSSIDCVQLHGDESPEFVENLRRLSDVKIIKALRVAKDFDPGRALDFRADHVLLDTWSRERFGGTGKRFDWAIALEIKKLVPDLFLSGGLNLNNVAEAIRTVKPFAVDVCSGVEAQPGKKNLTKMAEFIQNARRAI